jgi:hypothetical protein
MGCKIVARLPFIYTSNDVHYLLEYVPGVSRAVSRGMIAQRPIDITIEDPTVPNKSVGTNAPASDYNPEKLLESAK